jgi:predicted metal-dependent phosphoesterase TrpH
MRLELHCHSTFSDGSEPAQAVAERAQRAGLEIFCLTDHDTCAGFEATRAVLGERAMRGVELSCVEDGRTVHVLIYDVAGDERWAVVEAKLAEVVSARRGRLRKIAARLEELGIRIDVDAILAGAGTRTVGRPDIARALVEVGAVRSKNEAFERYLHDGGPADVPVARVTVAEGLEIGRAAGARMSLAHPHTHGGKAWQILRRHKDQGLEGIEAFYGIYSKRERKEWLKLAADEGLVATGGSDFHGEMMPRVSDVGIDVPQPYASRLCEWLGRA